MQSGPDQRLFKMSQKEAWGSLLWIVVILGGIYYLAHQFGVEEIRAFVERAGLWGPLVLIALKASTIIFAPLGGSPLYPIAGAFFGTWLGTLYVFLGDALGSAVAFYISRKFGGKVASRFLGEGGMSYLARITGYLGTTRGFLEARIFFMALPELVAYAAGLTKLPFWKFFLIHMGVHIIPTILYVMTGDLLLSGNPLVFLIAMVLASSLALVGFVWLHKKIKLHDGSGI